MHLFEESGLGVAPFKVVSFESSDETDIAKVFYCELCGTMIKHRVGIADRNNKLSVVGSDCAQKAHDSGINEGLKRLIKNQKAADRQAIMDEAQARQEAAERLALNGLTRQEKISQLNTKKQDLRQQFCVKLESCHSIVTEMEVFKFAKMCQFMAYNFEIYSARQLEVITEILTKKRSSARKNTKAYLAALPSVERELANLQDFLTQCRNTLDSISSQVADLQQITFNQ